MEQFTIRELYTLEETIAADLFEGAVYPWELLPKISAFIVELGEKLPKDRYTEVKEMNLVSIIEEYKKVEGMDFDNEMLEKGGSLAGYLSFLPNSIASLNHNQHSI